MDEVWQGIRVTVASDPRYLAPLRTLVFESLLIAGIEEEQAHKVVLAVQEACTNVIRHCYECREDERIDIVISFAPDRLEIRIDDWGDWVDPDNIRSRDLDDVKPGGLGVHLMQSTMDVVEYRKNEWGGTSLVMIKQLAPPEDPGAVEMDW
ncbi:MAG: ATP-binding protein [Planctomycetota bacterium]|jgi:anti-sigma regulatory factor (Ser/Thr protein kinase)